MMPLGLFVLKIFVFVVLCHSAPPNCTKHGCESKNSVGTNMLQAKTRGAHMTGLVLSNAAENKQQLTAMLRKLVASQETPCEPGDYNVSYKLGEEEMSDEEKDGITRRMESVNVTCRKIVGVVDDQISDDDAELIATAVFDGSDHNKNGALDSVEMWHFLHGDNVLRYNGVEMDITDYPNQLDAQQRVRDMMALCDADRSGGVSSAELKNCLFKDQSPALTQMDKRHQTADCKIGEPTGRTITIQKTCLRWVASQSCWNVPVCGWRGWSFSCYSKQHCVTLSVPQAYTCNSEVAELTDEMTCFVNAVKDANYVVREDCDFERGSADPEKNALRAPCTDMDKAAVQLNTVDYSKTKYSPVDYSVMIIEQMAEVGGTFYNDPGHKYTLEQTDNALSMVEQLADGYYKVLPNEGVAGFFDGDNGGYDSKTFYTKKGFTAAMGDIKVRNKWKAVSAGLEILSSFGGVLAIGFSIASAYIDYKDSIAQKDAQRELAQRLYETIMSEVGSMISVAQENNKVARERHSAVYYDRLNAELISTVKAAHIKMKRDAKRIASINANKDSGNKDSAMLYLQSFQDLMLFSRDTWLPPMGGTFNCVEDLVTCSTSSWDRFHVGSFEWEMDGMGDYGLNYKGTAPAGWDAYAKSKCFMQRQNRIYHIAPMMAWTLAAADTQVRIAKRVYAGDNVPTRHAGELEILFEMAQHYRTYMDNFQLSSCTGDNRGQPCSKSDKIIICSPPNVNLESKTVKICEDLFQDYGNMNIPGYGAYSYQQPSMEYCYADPSGPTVTSDFGYPSDYSPTTSKVWTMIQSVKGSLDRLLATKPAFLQESSSERVNVAEERRKWSIYAEGRPIMQKFLEICGGLPCTGTMTEEQHRAFEPYLDEHRAQIDKKYNL